MTNLFERLQSLLASRYRLERELGRGGMATVYLAEDLKHRRRVAIKVLDPELARAVGSERFLTEIGATAGLAHPHILPLLDSGHADEFVYYVTPFVEGESLRERFEQRGSLPLDEALRIAREALDALDYAHRRGIVHRDVKPENILLQDGHAVLADFGIARALDPGGAGLTATGVVVGTPAYMSPEQAGADSRVDGRSDVYSMACVLFEMIAGQPPFVASTTQSVVRQHLSANPPPIRQWRDSVPSELDAAVAKGLAKNPADRWSSAADFARALSSMTTTGESAPTTATGRSAVPAAPRRRLVPGLVGVGLLVALGAVLVWMVPRMGKGAAVSSIRSLAVLPLANLSGDAGQDYFAAGMTDELTTTLAQISDLKVVSRTSVLPYEHERKPLPEIGRELGVDAVIEGSVLRDGNEVRITAQLVQTANDRHLWAKSYRRNLRDVIALQAEVAQDIAGEVRVRLTPGERTRLADRHPVNPAAHDAVLRGRTYLDRMEQGRIQTAVELFRSAIQIDSSYAAGWAALGYVHYVLSNLYLAPDEAMPQARAAAEKALSLDSLDALAHTVRGAVLANYDWDWRNGERELRRAIELKPSDADVHFVLGTLLTATARFEEASRELQRAVELDPQSWYARSYLPMNDLLAGRPDYVEKARRLLSLPGVPPGMHLFNAQVLATAGRVEEARTQLAAAGGDEPFPGAHALVEAMIDAYAGDRVAARRIADKMAKPGRNAIAMWLYALVGDRDRAIACGQAAIDRHEEDIMTMAVSPWLVNLHGDPRYHTLLRRLGLEEAFARRWGSKA